MKRNRLDLIMIGAIPQYLGSKNKGGAAMVLWNSAKAIRKNTDIDFEIFAIGKYWKKYKIIDGIRINGLSIGDIIYLPKAIHYVIQNIKYFKKYNLFIITRLLYAFYVATIITNRYDAFNIHIHHITNQLSLAFKLINPKINIVLTIHSYKNLISENSNKVNKTVLRNINRQILLADHVTIVSESEKEKGINLGIINRKKIKVIYNGIKFYPFESLMNRKFDICFVGSISRQKGAKVLLKSICEIHDHVKNIVWIGEGPLKREIHNESKLPQSLFTGQINTKLLYNYLSESALMVLPSFSESFGLVYIESLFNKTPVIGYYKTLREISTLLGLNDEENRWLISYNPYIQDYKILSTKILEGLRLVENSNYLEIGRSIKNKVVNIFNWDIIYKKYIDLYGKNITSNI